MDRPLAIAGKPRFGRGRRGEITRARGVTDSPTSGHTAGSNTYIASLSLGHLMTYAVTMTYRVTYNPACDVRIRPASSHHSAAAASHAPAARSPRWALSLFDTPGHALLAFALRTVAAVLYVTEWPHALSTYILHPCQNAPPLPLLLLTLLQHKTTTPAAIRIDARRRVCPRPSSETSTEAAEVLFPYRPLRSIRARHLRSFL